MLAPRNFSDLITFTRASSATRFNASGVLETVGNNVARLDFDPVTLAARGLLVEEQRTNSIRNSTAQGAVAGTPGTMPTNWATTLPAGISQQVIGTGTESGISFLDIRFFGTTGAAANQEILIFPEGATTAAANGQTWTSSAYLKYVAGSLTGVTSGEVFLIPTNASLVALAAQNTVFTYGTAPLAQSRQTRTMTLTDATTAFIYTRFDVNVASSTAIDITLRIGLPQMEQGAFATSPIPTTNAAVTRSGDAATLSALSPWFNASEGTLFVETTLGAVLPTGFFGQLFDLRTDGLNRMSLYWNPSASNNVGLYVLVGGPPEQVSTSHSVNAGAPFKIGGAYKLNDFASSLNGAAVQTDVSGTLPAINSAAIGGPVGGGWGQQWLRRVSYYPRRLSNAELQTLTA